MDKSNVLSQATMLADLIEYQAGAVVSGALVKKRSGTVTLFASDEREGLSEHTTRCDALPLVVDGLVEITISGVAQDVRAGEIVALPADKPHAVKAVSCGKMLLVMLRSQKRGYPASRGRAVPCGAAESDARLAGGGRSRWRAARTLGIF